MTAERRFAICRFTTHFAPLRLLYLTQRSIILRAGMLELRQRRLGRCRPTPDGAEAIEEIMADLRNYQTRAVPRAPAPTQPSTQGLRAYMLKVYNLMALGLVITGVAASARSCWPPPPIRPRRSLRCQRQDADRLRRRHLRLAAALGGHPCSAGRWCSSCRSAINSMSVSAAQTTFWVYAGAGRPVAVVDLPDLHQRQHRADLLRDGRRLRRAVALRLHDQARPDRDGLVPDHGRVRPDHRDGGQHLPGSRRRCSSPSRRSAC